jgi:transcription factor IIIB subunit 2
VSEVTFEEDGHGGANAVGQFVSVDMRGGGGLSGAATGFHTGIGKESREITLRNAKRRITEVSVQLRYVCVRLIGGNREMYGLCV